LNNSEGSCDLLFEEWGFLDRPTLNHRDGRKKREKIRKDSVYQRRRDVDGIETGGREKKETKLRSTPHDATDLICRGGRERKEGKG